nr:PadR family transcriptional regulator [uncultured Agathobaculum sp.]
MLGSDVMRGYNDMLILCLLLEGDSYGYAISHEIERRSGGVYPIKETTLYSAFGRLEKLGFIAPYQGAETQGRPRTYYTITDEGRMACAAKCAEWRVIKAVVDRFAKEDIPDGSDP